MLSKIIEEEIQQILDYNESENNQKTKRKEKKELPLTRI